MAKVDKKEVFSLIYTMTSAMHFSGGEHGHQTYMGPDVCPHEFCVRSKAVREELESVYDVVWMYDELCE